MSRFLDLDHPFFLPLWRRAALVAALLVWTVLEVIIGSSTWAMLFGALGLYAAYAFFVAWDPEAVKKRLEEKK